MSSVTLRKMFAESNMNPWYAISCDEKKVLLSGCIKISKRRNSFVTLMLPVRYSSSVSLNIIRSSMHIISLMVPYKLDTSKGGFLNLMNFLDHEGKPFGSTTRFKSFDLAKYLEYFLFF